MTFKVIIPARYASNRLPGKPLLDIVGKPMVVHVVERALQSDADEVIVATDHEKIAQVVKNAGYQVVMTHSDHASGTDRIAEVVDRRGWSADTIVVNVQGDEPLISPHLINEVAADLQGHPAASIATASHPIHDKDSLLNPNVVKVITDHEGYALYFSRAPIPYPRDAFAVDLDIPTGLPAYKHIGIYAYRAAFLQKYKNMQPVPIEQFESLEQLRALWHGHKICVLVTQHAQSPGVDTKADLEYVRTVLLQQ